MMLYEKNLAFFKDKSKQVYNILSKDIPLYNCNLEKVEGTYNYILENDNNRCFIHSIYNIEDEMKMMFKDTPKDIETIVLFGLGCGYALDYMTDNFPKLRNLIIIEPSLQMFKTLVNYIDIEEYCLKINAITFVVNQSPDFALNLVAENLFNNLNMDIVYNLSYRTLFKDYYETIASEILKNIAIKRTDIATVVYAAHDWFINAIKNFKQECIPIENIFSIFKGKPAVLVSAGPSLNKNIHLIKELSKKAIIVAVGSAIKILDHHGIEPHFRMAVDGKEHEKKMILDGVNIQHIPLLFGNKLYRGILPKYKGNKIRFIEHTDYIGKYIYEKAQIPYTEIRIGSSIANGTLSLFCIAGCSKVIFLGQDLCYTDGELHAKGAYNNAYEELGGNLSEFIKTKDIFANEVYTKTAFLSVKYMLEEVLSCYPGIQFINATEGGIGIDGTEIKTLKQVLDEDLKENLNININESVNEFFKNKEGYMRKIKETVDEMEKYILEVLEVNEQRSKYLEKIKKNINKNVNVNRILNDFNYLNTFENKLNENKLYTNVLLMSILEIIKSIELTFRYNGEDKKKQAEAMYKISSSVFMVVKQYGNLVKETIESIK
ncbi:DUF115 domain-containing protein [Clostridium aestuarii]|uniref:DUF115 domain-containing protein n=1 Tax=Clostridium aestuarii TaxID=338193 RepID=A0ABT4D0G7_9CLOT|nr:6-hydroxymethylpterin diphosphokinase MptE-like protein [Clostridium aestuarii]MCY6483670.1 DUF115 domain-containing protein [Clostridium aestuarii]